MSIISLLQVEKPRPKAVNCSKMMKFVCQGATAWFPRFLTPGPMFYAKKKWEDNIPGDLLQWQ